MDDLIALDTSPFSEVARELSRLHENFVIVPADKASNNHTFVCKRHYVSILIELRLNSLPRNATYNLSSSEVLDNHKSVPIFFGLGPKVDELDLPWIFIGFLRCTNIHINID